MTRRIVTVNSLWDLPAEVIARLNEIVIYRDEFDTAATSVIASYLAANSSALATANRFVKRDANGNFEVKDPTAPQHPVSLKVLDARISATGIPVATELAAGLMSALDKVKLRESSLQSSVATSLNDLTTPGWYTSADLGTVWVTSATIGGVTTLNQLVMNTLVYRSKVGAGAWSSVELLSDASALATSKLSGVVSLTNLPRVSQLLDGLMLAADKKTLDEATSAATGNTLVRRTPAGEINVVTGSAGTNATTKTYVDTQVATKANSAHGHDGADIISGLINEARIANASSVLNGLMSKEDKASYDARTATNTPSTVVMRSAGGQSTFSQVVLADAAPTLITHATRKDYVDALVSTKANLSHTHSGADITSGLINEARIANATSSLNGLMTKEDKAKLDAATASPTDNTLVVRYNGGETNFKGIYLSAGPVSNSHATRKDYVDGLVGSVMSSTALNTTTGEDLNDKLTTGFYHQSANAGATAGSNYPVNTAGTLFVMPYSSFVFQEYTAFGNANRKFWRTKYGTSWSIWAEASQEGHIHALATSTSDGFMPKQDRALLNAASAATVNSSLVLRSASGHISTNVFLSDTVQSTAVNSMTRKDYVDGLIAKQVGYYNLGSEKLNTIRTGGVYNQPSGTPVTLANNYPIDGAAGALEVIPFNTSNPSTWIIQEWTQWSPYRKWGRGGNAAGGDTGWTAWVELTASRATATTDGLMPNAFWSMLNSASSSYGPSRIVMTDAAGVVRGGVFYTDAPQNSNGVSLTRKDYVDGLIALQADKVHTHSRIEVGPGIFGLYSSGVGYYQVDGVTKLNIQLDGRVTSNAAPTSTGDLANKSYVDGKVWDGADITTGLINQARIANATASLNGLLSNTDKAKLDASTNLGTGNTLMMRNSAGQVSVADPNHVNHAASKGYVDAEIASLTPGLWYPLALEAGFNVPTGQFAPAARINNGTLELRGSLTHTGTSSSMIATMDWPSIIATYIATKVSSGYTRKLTAIVSSGSADEIVPCTMDRTSIVVRGLKGATLHLYASGISF